jgi:phosphate transport system permease protein
MTAHAGTPAPPAPAPLGESRRRSGSPFGMEHLGDVVFRLVCHAGAFFIILLAAALLVVLLWKSGLAIKEIGASFFVSETWDPEPTHRLFGARAFIYGTVATSAIAMLIAVPLGVGTAAFLSEIAPGWLRRGGSFFVEMLAAVPSVVYGFWGLFVLVPALHSLGVFVGNPDWSGIGILPAGIVLAIMIVPYVAAVSFDVCRAVPSAQREGSLALGASRWQTIWSVVLPYARPGIIGGCFIALGRALGETMAVTMLIGNRTGISFSPFALGNSIASVIANEFTEATYDLYLSALVELGLALLLVSVVVNALARLLLWRVNRVGKKASFFGGRLAMLLGAANQPKLLAPAGENNSDSEPISRPAVKRAHRKARVVDFVMTWVLGLCWFATLLPLFLILGHLIYHGINALNWDFFTKLPVPVGQIGGGMANAIYGSFLLVGLATLFAVPVGLLASIFLVEYRSDYLGPSVRFIGELLGGVPSIVIGIFAYTLVVKPMGHFSGWAGGFALGVMMVPIVMRASEEALKLVPRTIRDASYALGAKHYQTVLRVTVPAALPAIITAVFLAIARVAGETAPLLLTASGNQYWPRSPNDFTPSLPVYIFTYAVSPYDDWHRQAWAAALVLLAVVMILNFGVRFATGKRVLLASRAG